MQPAMEGELEESRDSERASARADGRCPRRSRWVCLVTDVKRVCGNGRALEGRSESELHYCCNGRSRQVLLITANVICFHSSDGRLLPKQANCEHHQ